MTTVSVGRSIGLSPQSRMGNGYGGASKSLSELDGVWNWRVLHPWMMRCVLALFFSDPRTVQIGYDDNGLAIRVTSLGNGSSGRETGPAAVANFWSRNSRTYLAGRPSRMTPEGRAWLRPGMAPIAYPGTSNHEDDTWENYCLAVDATGWEDGWMVANCGRFGLSTFSAAALGNEDWHLHPAGYPASKSSLQAELRLRPLPAVNLPWFGRPTTEIEDNMKLVHEQLARAVMQPGVAVHFPSPHLVGAKAAQLNITVTQMAHSGYLTMRKPDGTWSFDVSAISWTGASGRESSSPICVVEDGKIILGYNGEGGTQPVTVDIDIMATWS